MAAGRALPLVAGIRPGNRQSSKDLDSYGPLPATLSGEECAVNGGSINESWRDAAPNRCGSAPPSMEDSLAELGHLIGKHSGDLEATLRNLSSGSGSLESEVLCSDPAYIKYFDAKVNLNPRLATPRVLRGGGRVMNRFGKAGEWRPVSRDSRSTGMPLTHRSTLSMHKEEPEDDKSAKLDLSLAEDARCVSNQSTFNIGSHRSEVVGLMQEKFPQSTALYDNSSCSSNTSSSDGGSACSGINSSENSPVDIVKSLDLNGFPPDTHQLSPKPTGSPPTNTLNSNGLAASRPSTSSSSDHNTIMGASEQGNPSVNTKSSCAASAMCNGVDSGMKDLKISLDTQRSAHAIQHWQTDAFVQNGPSHGDPTQMIPRGINLPQVPFVDNFSHAHMNLHFGGIQLLSQHGMTPPHNPYYHNSQLSGVSTPPYGIDGNGFPGSFLPPFMTNFAPHLLAMTPFNTPLTPSFSGRLDGLNPTGNIVAGTEFFNPFNIHEQLGVTMPSSLPDLSLVHYFPQPSMYHYGHRNPYGTVSSDRNFVGNPAAVFGSEKFLSEPMHQSGQKFQFPTTGACSPPTTKKGGSYFGNHQSTSSYNSMPMPYPTSPVFQSQPLSGTYHRDRTNDARGFQSSSETMGLSPGIQRQQWREKSDPNACSFAGEVKSNKNHRVELSDIKGHIVEYSCDQNGSRFIQQKLANCTTEEKALVLAEILPHAPSLMTDVFGNYVIQKLFEHGDTEQRRDLAKMLTGHVLLLSLQMYGCRVFQKALEAVELDQKIALIRELDEHVLRCVRDQNGNHVIQKCIECVPMKHISFIVSAFQGQVATLSMHPYGCRVIQRILEHCSDYSEGIIDEILQSACILAQDQYGNYVTQHILEKGETHERSQIISKLAGQVVSMSQNKYASNVIEKCFQHGDVAERDLLIKEILEQTEGNDYLPVMMKDQFANYVIQKILETCNEQQREALLSRMKCHVHALKKYSYGKHIASRIERLSGDCVAPSES
uniref:Uncharacterized protein n=1 Tax=Avena sativa TaxID=4498 RepID=A0ACD5XMY0_AVESA